MNINAPHFTGWTFVPGSKHRFPAIQFDMPAGYMRPREITVSEPADSMQGLDDIARLLANSPELLKLAERFFSFYQLHKTARGGQLGCEYEALRAKIMGAPQS